MNIDKDTAVVILNYRNYTDTINCIESVLRESQSCCMIVVDNNSNNGSLDEIAAHFQGRVNYSYYQPSTDVSSYRGQELLLVQNMENGGYAKGNNVGLRLAYSLGFKYLMVLNNDTIFKDTKVSLLTSVLEENPDALCVGPLLYKEDGETIDFNCAKRRATYWDFFVLSYFGQWFKSKRWIKNYYYLKANPTVGEAIAVDLISGSCMVFHSDRLHRIGYFDEGTFLYYEEDIMAEKGRRAGFRFYFQPKTQLIHLGAKTMKNHSHSAITLKSSYNSAIYYLTVWRGLSPVKARFVCFSKYLFMKLYLLKRKIVKR